MEKNLKVEIEISGMAEIRVEGQPPREAAVRVRYEWDDENMTVRGGQLGENEWRVTKTYPLSGDFEREERVDNTLRWFGLTRQDIGID